MASAAIGWGVWATSNPHTWTNGLVGYWSFDGKYTTSTDGTADVSDNDNWGTFNGGVKPVAGISGQALSFDGVDDYVDCGDIAATEGIGALTIEAWFYANSFGTNDGIVGKRQSGVDDSWGVMTGTGNVIQFRTWTSAGAVLMSSNTALLTNTWHHIVAIYDGVDMRIYRNGVLDSTPSAQTGNIIAGDSSVWIGAYYDIGNTFDGLIDEVRIYNRALSADEIQQHYEQTRRNIAVKASNNNGLVGYWNMNEGSGSIANDVSANDNDGTLTWMATSSNGGWVDGKQGYGLSFDGVDDYVDCGTNSSLDITEAITLEAWVKLADNVGNGYLVTKRTNYTGYTLWHSTTYLYVSLYLDDGAGGYTSAQVAFYNVPANTWLHVVGTYDKQTVRLYVNGIEAPYPQAQTTSILSSVGSVKIGGYPGYYSEDIIDEVRIYNRALGEEEITRSYQAGLSRLRVATANPHDWSDGLVGYWNFNGQNTTSSGTRDMSDEDNWGELKNGVKPIAGIVGQALSFDGVDDYVEAVDSASLDITDVITIESWINLDEIPATGYSIISKFSDWDFIITSDRYGRFRVAIDGTVRTQFTSFLTTSIWYHLVGTYDGDKLRTYVNGSLVGTSVSYTGSIGTNDQPLRIGKVYIYGDTYQFDGLIDEVRIYNRALGAEEIQQHFLQTRRNLRL